MATAVIMPKQGQSVESCIITKWHKNRRQGKTGDILFPTKRIRHPLRKRQKKKALCLPSFEEGDDVECL